MLKSALQNRYNAALFTANRNALLSFGEFRKKIPRNTNTVVFPADLRGDEHPNRRDHLFETAREAGVCPQPLATLLRRVALALVRCIRVAGGGFAAEIRESEHAVPMKISAGYKQAALLEIGEQAARPARRVGAISAG